MEITFYGTGSCIPKPKTDGKPFRSHSGWHTEIGSNSLLFDIGGGLLHKMLIDGRDIMKLPSHIFISHLHMDHTLDLFQLMQGRAVASRYMPIDKTFIFGPVGIGKLVKEIWNIYKEEFKLEEFFEIKEVTDGTVSENTDYKVSSSRINHFENSICYRLDSQGKSIVYSGDMGYDGRICELGKDSDLAIMECSFPDSRAKNHIGPADIGKLAKLGEFKKIVLTHITPFCDGKEEEIVKTIRNIHDVEVIVGYDFLKVEV